jgi:hypothetical protein
MMTTKNIKISGEECPIIDSPVSIPVMSAREMITCAAVLSSVSIEEDGSLVSKLHAQISEVSNVLKMKVEEPAEKTGRVRNAALRHDATVGAVYGVVEGHARFPLAEAPQVAAANRVKNALFPEGVAWLRASAAEKWGTSSAKLHLIEESPSLLEDLILLLSPVVLATWRESHAELGEALGVGGPVEPDDGLRDIDTLQLTRALRESISDYVRVVRGTVDRDDPATIAEANRLLTPLLNFRGLLTASKSAREDAPAEVPTPVPSTPPVAAGTVVDVAVATPAGSIDAPVPA